jgi:hypothetical protein
LLTRLVFSLTVLALALSAVPVVVTDTVLDDMPSGSSSFVYTGLDGAGTSLTASRAGGDFTNLVGGTWPGLWFGSNDTSGAYSFQFSAPVQFVEFYFTAASTGGGFEETFTNFSANSAGALAIAFTNVLSASWNGTTVSGNVDDFRFRIRITAGPGDSFTTASFNHIQTGAPAGTVISEMIYELQDGGQVPEPATVLTAGLALAALAWRQGRQRG